jgi:seryl-tRNA synthetase
MKEVSAHKLIKDASVGQTERYNIANTASNNLITELGLAPQVIEKPLVEKIKLVHDNERMIHTQVYKLRQQQNSLSKSIKTMKAMYDDANNVIKQTGNVQNWAEMLDGDLRVLEEMLRIKNNNNNNNN